MTNKKTIDWGDVFNFQSIGFILIGVACATFSIKGFMIPNHFIDGGINGISILIMENFHVYLAIPLILLNLPFIYIGYQKISKSFGIKSMIAVILLSIAVEIIHIAPVTTDRVLIAIFGGVFIGLGIGFIIRAGGVIDGLEILALFTRRRSNLSNNEILIGIASLVFIILGIEYGWDKSMYSILTYFTAVKAADYVVEGIEEHTSISIISSHEDEIKQLIVKEFKKGIAVYKGERGYLPSSFNIKHDCDIIVTIVTRLETRKIQEAVLKIDPQAFVFMQSLKEVNGGVIKKMGHHK